MGVSCDRARLGDNVVYTHAAIDRATPKSLLPPTPCQCRAYSSPVPASKPPTVAQG